MPVTDSQAAASDDQPVIEGENVQEQTPEEGSAEDGQQQEQSFTRADVEKMLADQEDRFNRLLQSQVAKSENRTNQRIQERLQALADNREILQLTDDQFAAAENAIIQEEQKNAFKKQGSRMGNETPQADTEEDAARFVTSQIEDIFSMAGARVTPDDPEFAMIEKEWNDPNGSLTKTLFAASEAARKKAERLAAFKGKATARVNTGTGTQGNTQTSKPKTAEEKISAGLKEKNWPTDTPQNRR